MKKKFFIGFISILLMSCSSTNNVTITFVQDGQEDIVFKVEKGSSFSDIPNPVEIEGHTIKWEQTDFSHVDEDIVVKTISSVNKYTLNYDLGIVSINDPYLKIDYLSSTYDWNTEINLLTPLCEGYIFLGWRLNGEDYVSPSFIIKNNVTFTANWMEDDSNPRWWGGN